MMPKSNIPQNIGAVTGSFMIASRESWWLFISSQYEFRQANANNIPANRSPRFKMNLSCILSRGIIVLTATVIPKSVADAMKLLQTSSPLSVANCFDFLAMTGLYLCDGEVSIGTQVKEKPAKLMILKHGRSCGAKPYLFQFCSRLWSSQRKAPCAQR